MRGLLSLFGSPFWKGLFGAVIGTGLLLLGLHAYQDHRALHDLINVWNVHGPKLLTLPAPPTRPGE